MAFTTSITGVESVPNFSSHVCFLKIAKLLFILVAFFFFFLQGIGTYVYLLFFLLGQIKKYVVQATLPTLIFYPLP